MNVTPIARVLVTETQSSHVNMYLVKTNCEKNWHVPCLAEVKETFLR